MKRIAQEAVPAAPPIAVSGLTFLGMTLQEWVYLATFVYTLLLIIYIIPKIKRSWKGEGQAPEGGA